jgi:hypothetical protein
MRFWISGPRMGFFRPGVSFNAGGYRRFAGSPSTGATPGGFVYVIAGDHGLRKIGSSNTPARRLAELQTGSPYRLWIEFQAPVYGSALDVELAAHAIHEPHRGLGEWFSVSPNIAVAAIYGGAERSGVSMIPTFAAAPSIRRFLPKTALGWLFAAFTVLFVAGQIMKLSTPPHASIDLGQQALDEARAQGLLKR